ncbi:HAD family hydrolase [Verrucomicrobiota bacterium]
MKLFVFDFDGTALGGHDPYERFPKLFVRFIDGLAARGIRWATNSGRALEQQFDLLQGSGVRTRPALLIGSTGTRMGWVRAGRLVHDRKHERQTDELSRQFKKRMWPTVRTIFLKLLDKDLVDRISFDSFSPLCIIDFTCRESCEQEVWRLMQPLLDSGDYYEFDPNRIGPSAMLFPCHMNKGAALRTLQDRLRIGPEQTIVAGDETNDLHMFDPGVAKWMVCPANANPLVKQAVRKADGIVARKRYSWGVIEGVERILKRAKGQGSSGE